MTSASVCSLDMEIFVDTGAFFMFQSCQIPRLYTLANLLGWTPFTFRVVPRYFGPC